MANYTKILNLEKPLQSEYYNVDIFNSNSDKIDEYLGNFDLAHKLNKGTYDGDAQDLKNDIDKKLSLTGGTVTGVLNVTGTFSIGGITIGVEV